MTRKEKQINRGDVYWINLDPTIGSEITKTRPAIIISNDIQNELSSRVIVMPLTSNTERVYRFEVIVSIKGKDAKAMSDQIRSIDKLRIGGYISNLSATEMKSVDLVLKKVLSLD